jgi:hypothetical protein
MKVEAINNLTALKISDLDRLDPITVIFQNFGPGEGRIFIQCYDKVWSSYWGSMSGKTVQEFVAGSGVDYIVNNLVSHALPVRQRKAEVAYVMRIVTAVQAALSLQGEAHV